QVHPADDDPALAGDESGKPEAWVVLDAEPGAGLYLGFRDGVSRGDVARALAANAKLDAMMNFVPVGAGDAFVIDAGTPHAIGAGVTLLEPQFVRPGRRGLTYRYWDWDRRYDEAGRLDPAGAPRELHVARSLDVTRWDRGGGAAFVAGCRATADVLVRGAATRTRVVRWRWFEVERWSGTGRLRIDATSRLWALTSVGGSVRVSTSGSELSLACGESGVVPAALGDLVVDLAAGDVFAVTT
ncbi:MAG: class I mannose-6-phosphate isomerase, partial [Deltaproteobacteria bacterium]|nr:class I mannose-6-phosphate isomerase [Deltaproteobacteria bacterium]